MSYQQTTFIVNELIAEPLSDALMAHGALSAAIEDAYAGTDGEQAIFGEPGIESEQIWHNSKILALFDEKADVAAIVAAAAEAVEIPPPAYQIELLPEQDWVRLTQDYPVVARSTRCKRRQSATGPRPGFRHGQPPYHPPVPAMAG